MRPKQGNKKGPRTRANNHNQSWNGPQDMNGGVSGGMDRSMHGGSPGFYGQISRRKESRRNQIDELVGERSVTKIEKKKSLAESRWSTTGSTPSHVQVKLDAIAKSDKVVGDPFKTKSVPKNPNKLIAVDNDGRDKLSLAAPNGLVNGSLSTPGSIPSLAESRPNSKRHRSDKTTGVPSATKADREKFVAEFDKNGEDLRTPPAQKIEKALTTILEVEVEVEETDRAPVSKVEENAKPAEIDMDEAMVVKNGRKRATSLYSHSSKASDDDDIEIFLRKQANFLLAEAAEWKGQAANSHQEHKETKKVHEKLDMKFNARLRILETKDRALKVLEADKKKRSDPTITKFESLKQKLVSEKGAHTETKRQLTEAMRRKKLRPQDLQMPIKHLMRPVSSWNQANQSQGAPFHRRPQMDNMKNLAKELSSEKTEHNKIMRQLTEASAN
ncbi:uncharacterized protein RAG0_06275 [Rhynchosporium agropyri]|uniref:Uncharacterized protein n=1 Tax=Rhynchosporium agropyri TaxID=914238 RepID=A0A1E1KGF0_9HELO|nr:uncharacterized protein RAG0_06275 [Rhynchosporium agropyri]